MTNDRHPLPGDAAERRRLYREWIHVDLPASTTPRGSTVVRRPMPPGDWLHDVLASPAGVIEGLSAAVRASLVGAELPGTDRARLLRRAERLGLNRFEANLLIAAVQNRVRTSPPDAPPRFVATLPPERPLGVAKLVACAVAIEAIIGVACGYWLIAR